MHRFGEHRLKYEKRRVQLLDSLGYPTVMLFRPVEKSDQRSGVNDGRASRPKPARCSGFEARSGTPESIAPRAPFISVARLLRRCISRGTSSTSRNPSSTKSLSLRPRSAASALAGGRDHSRFRPWFSSALNWHKTIYPYLRVARANRNGGYRADLGHDSARSRTKC